MRSDDPEFIPSRRALRVLPAAGPLDETFAQALEVVEDAMAPRVTACSRCGDPLAPVVDGPTVHWDCLEMDWSLPRDL